MSKTPRCDAVLNATRVSVQDELERIYALARTMEEQVEHLFNSRQEMIRRMTNAERQVELLKKELAQVTSDFQAACEHEFVTENHSFSHEFGTEKIFVCRCTKCGKDAEPGDATGPEGDEDRDYDRERELREDAT